MKSMSFILFLFNIANPDPLDVFSFILAMMYVGVVIYVPYRKKYVLTKRNKNITSLFESRFCPGKLLSGIYWNFKDRSYESYDEFIEVVKLCNKERGVDWNPSEFLLKSEKMTIQYTYLVQKGKSEKKVFSFYSDDMNFTSGELLYKIHNELVDIMKHRRYTYLNYLEWKNEDDINNPVYKLKVTNTRYYD